VARQPFDAPLAEASDETQLSPVVSVVNPCNHEEVADSQRVCVVSAVI
jgi:hypothetical protein